MTAPNLSILTNVSLFQQPDPIKVHSKQTSQQVLDEWKNHMTAINAIINKVGTAGNPASAQISEAERAAFQTSVTNLIDLAQNGFEFTIQTDPGPPPVNADVRDVITVSMAKDLDNLLRTIESAHPGAQLSPAVNIPIDALRAWRDFAEASPVIKQVVGNMNDAIYVGGVGHTSTGYTDGVYDSQGRLIVGSLQSMVELLFVKTGNEMMAENLEQLEKALQTNKESLEVLTTLQSIHNEIAAFSKGEQPLDVGVTNELTPTVVGVITVPLPTRDTNTQAAYNKGADIQKFYESIIPELGPGMASAYDVMDAYKAATDKIALAGFNATSYNALKTAVTNAIAAMGGTGIDPNVPIATWNTTARTDLAVAIQNYRNLVIPFNAAITKLNALMAPFGELFGAAPGEPFTIPDVISVSPGTFNYNRIPMTTLPVLPDFGSENIPFEFNAVPSETTSSSAAIIQFRDSLLVPFKNELDDSDFDPVSILQMFTASDGFTPLTPISIADALYSNPDIVKGDPQNGLPPIANIDMANKIKVQYELLKSQIAELSQNENQVGSPNTLLARLNAVVSDLKRSGVEKILNISGLDQYNDATEAITRRDIIKSIDNFAKIWILDDLANTSSAFSGKIQENLGFAITAAESLNDQQKEETRRFLFLFEEFYKSASAILTKLTQLIEKMAQNINR